MLRLAGKRANDSGRQVGAVTLPLAGSRRRAKARLSAIVAAERARGSRVADGVEGFVAELPKG
jgi:hypothetical protein